MNIGYSGLAARMLRLRQNWRILFSANRNAQQRPCCEIFENGAEPVFPRPGHLWVRSMAWTIRWSVVRTNQADIVAFGEVDAAFAWDEGEGDRPHAWSRDAPQGSPGGDCTDPDAAPARYGAAVAHPSYNEL